METLSIFRNHFRAPRALRSRLAALPFMLALAGSAFAQDVPAPAAVPEVPPPADTASKDADPGFILWSDSSISLLPYGQGFEVDPDEQSALTLEYAHASTIGDLFVFVDFYKFHGVEDNNYSWYGEISPRLSLGKLLGKDFSHTFFSKSMFEIKDVLLAMQYERGEDADAAEAILLGVGLDLDVREAGILGGLGKFNYVQLNFYARGEMTEGVRRGFNDMQVTMVASYPFKIGKTDWLLDGYYDWVVGFGSEDWSYHLNPQLTMDVGALWNEPKKLYVGIEGDLWWQKYQIPNSNGFDTNQAAVSLLLKYHF